MPADTALGSALNDALADIERADVVVGIPSYNNVTTIDGVVAAASAGLRASFPDARCAIVNSDGGSADGTPDAVRRHDGADVRVVSGAYEGPPGKGSALRAVFEAARLLGARAACVVDADLRSITPQWIERLLRPVVDGRAGYVTPLYARHKHDGTITNTVVYPLVRALYGQRVRQPIGGEFGFSGELAAAFLAQDVWRSDVARFGIDVFMTTTALARRERVVQAALGAKVHDAKDPAAHLGPMFEQVLTSAARQAARTRDAWRAIWGSRPLPVEGDLAAIEPEAVSVDLAALDAKHDAASGADRARWETTLCAPDLALFERRARERRPADEPLARAWARIVYDVIGASLRDPAATEDDVRALLPLYFGRVAAHVRAAAELTTAEAESLVEDQARAFEAEKGHLLERAS